MITIFHKSLSMFKKGSNPFHCNFAVCCQVLFPTKANLIQLEKMIPCSLLNEFRQLNAASRSDPCEWSPFLIQAILDPVFTHRECIPALSSAIPLLPSFLPCLAILNIHCCSLLNSQILLPYHHYLYSTNNMIIWCALPSPSKSPAPFLHLKSPWLQWQM